ncbi:MAG: Arm DNA-binding domain-containing protein [Alphaproteobacteria bacterium]
MELRVTATGLKSWHVRYRVTGGDKQKHAVIGPYPTIGLADTRERARDIHAAAKKGIDLPEQERRATEAPATLALPLEPTGRLVDAGASAAGITPAPFRTTVPRWEVVPMTACATWRRRC